MISTQQKITNFLVNTKDHVSPKRAILQHVQYRKDFVAVYQAMLDAGIIEERGIGCRGCSKMVFITHKGLHPEMYDVTKLPMS
jgi:hypothetical protein